MSKNTCGNCEHLKTHNAWRGMYMATCGLTDGIIVPHGWEGDTITLWRVPTFCKNPDKEPSESQAPSKDWVKIKVGKSTEK